MRKLQAVYEGGVLRPTEALPLEEHQLVSVIVLDEEPGDEEIEFEPAQHFEALADRSIDRNAVRAALSRIPGSLDADSQRNGTSDRWRDISSTPAYSPSCIMPRPAARTCN